MRMLLLLALLAGTVALPRSFAADKDDKVAFDVYDGYVEKKDSGVKGDASFLVFFDYPRFKKVFSVADPKGDKKMMPADVFNMHQVFALIKRGDKPLTYKVEKATADGDKLSIYYTAETGEGKDGKYASPLILSVRKKGYKQIAFFENGKEVGGLELKDK